MAPEVTVSSTGSAPDVASVPEVRPAGVRLLLRWAFSFPAWLCTLLAALTVLTVKSRLNDPDVWWHLKVGEIVWNTHAIPRIDPFSFTTHGHAWIAHEWLAQLTIYGAWKFGGYTGLMLWLCVLPSLLCILVYMLCWLYSGNAKVSLLGGLTGWFFATVGLSIRPLVIGHVCLVLELLIIHLARTRDRRWLIALPPLFAIWVNCHGSYMAGLIVLGIFVCCSFFDFSAGALVSKPWPADARRWLVPAGVLSVAALLLNPVGPRLLFYPLDVFLHQSNSMAFVSEWQHLDLTDERAWVLFGIAGMLFLLALIRRAEFRLEEVLLLALAFGMAIRHQRMLIVFGILVAPIVSRLLSGAWERYDPRRDHRIANAVLMLATVAIIFFSFPTSAELRQQVDKGSPVRAVDFIRRSGLRGPMLNDYGFGGYLIWALPQEKVFIDGRADVYDWTGVFAEMGRWAYLQENPNLLLDKYQIHFCILNKGGPLPQVLPFLPGWKRVYADDQAVIFVRTQDESAAGALKMQ